MHQSNHVFFVLDFVSGTFAQKCHDPACASFRCGSWDLCATLAHAGFEGCSLPAQNGWWYGCCLLGYFSADISGNMQAKHYFLCLLGSKTVLWSMQAVMSRPI